MRNMKNSFLAILFFLGVFFFSNNAISIIMTEKDINKILEPPTEPSTPPTKTMSVEIVVVDRRVELGKKLFFDPILSRDRKVSCASCHKAEHGFADDKPVSIGIDGQKGDRNTPTVFNASNLKLLFWDGRAKGLEDQALGPIQNPKEMGETIENVLKKLNNHPFYSKEFKEAFGASPITPFHLANAIATFERTLISKDSDYDRYIQGKKGALSEGAMRGWNLFYGKAMCFECHKGNDFTDGDFHNIGLPITDDVGRGKISQDAQDVRKFKTPTLREVANTAPYFHSGQFETLEQVITFYNAGGGEDTYKDPLKKPLNLNEQEQKDLIAFLKSLSGRQQKVIPPVLPR